MNSLLKTLPQNLKPWRQVIRRRAIIKVRETANKSENSYSNQRLSLMEWAIKVACSYIFDIYYFASSIWEIPAIQTITSLIIKIKPNQTAGLLGQV